MPVLIVAWLIGFSFRHPGLIGAWMVLTSLIFWWLKHGN